MFEIIFYDVIVVWFPVESFGVMRLCLTIVALKSLARSVMSCEYFCCKWVSSWSKFSISCWIEGCFLVVLCLVVIYSWSFRPGFIAFVILV
jgi:hypothetical protein